MCLSAQVLETHNRIPSRKEILASSFEKEKKNKKKKIKKKEKKKKKVIVGE